MMLKTPCTQWSHEADVSSPEACSGVTGRATTFACLCELVMGIAALQGSRHHAVHNNVRVAPDILTCRRCLTVGVCTLACLRELVVGVAARQGGRQQAVHNEVGVASDGGGEVGVLRDRQRIVPPVLAHINVPCAEIPCHLQPGCSSLGIQSGPGS